MTALIQVKQHKAMTSKNQQAASSGKKAGQSSTEIPEEEREECDTAFISLQKLPGGHIYTKGSAKDLKRGEKESVPPELLKRIRTALNVLYFKMPLREFRSTEDLLEMMLVVREQVPFTSTEMLTKVFDLVCLVYRPYTNDCSIVNQAFKVHGIALRNFLRVKRRTTLPTYMNEVMYLTVSNITLIVRYMDLL